jgi:putative phosphoribosyl transferase
MVVAAVESKAVNVGALGLPGEWVGPPDAAGLVVFAHGSGSSRASPRNRLVADVLHEHGLATLLFDLLTTEESHDQRRAFDITLLTRRLVDVLDGLREQSAKPVGLFGASTGAAAALCACTQRPERICAVVSRGGRTDLAAPAVLAQVNAPTLLIAGGADREVLRVNRAAMRLLRGERRLEVVPGATHLFEEPGALDTLAQLAADWFEGHCRHRAGWA